MDQVMVETRVHALLDAWNARDLDAFVAAMTEDVVWHDLGMPNPPVRGRPAVRAFAASALRAFPDFRYAIRAPICVAADGGSCLVPFTLTATHTAALDPPGFAPVNRAVRFDGLDYITFRGELVARIETRFDPAEPIEQLTGIVLRPPRTPAGAGDRATLDARVAARPAASRRVWKASSSSNTTVARRELRRVISDGGGKRRVPVRRAVPSPYEGGVASAESQHDQETAMTTQHGRLPTTITAKSGVKTATRAGNGFRRSSTWGCFQERFSTQ